MTLGERINSIPPEAVVSLRNEYGVCWIGKAKYVFGAVTLDAWNSTQIEVKKEDIYENQR